MTWAGRKGRDKGAKEGSRKHQQLKREDILSFLTKERRLERANLSGARDERERRRTGESTVTTTVTSCIERVFASAFHVSLRERHRDRPARVRARAEGVEVGCT